MRDHPQRLAPSPIPGTLLKRAAGLAQRVKLHETTDRDPVYLTLIRELPCLKCGLEPCREAAHVRMQSGAHNKHGGMGKKPADRWALPLCAACHRIDKDSQHVIGEDLFWHILGINPLLVASRLWAAKGDLVRMRAVVLVAIGGRIVIGK